MDYNQKELQKGREVEREHLETIKWVIAQIKSGHIPEDDDVCRKIALDHLKEDPEYYSKLETLGL